MHRIIKNDLQLKCLKRSKAQKLTTANQEVQVKRCRELLKRYPAETVNFIWFTDEKLFTVAAPSNTQKDHVYIRTDVRKKDIHLDCLAMHSFNI